MSSSEDVKFSNVRGLYLKKYGRLRSKKVILEVATYNLQKWRGFAQSWGPCMPIGHPLLFIVLRIYNFDLIFHLTSIWRWVLSGPEAINNLTTVVEFNNHPQKKEKIGLECLYFFYLIQGKSNKKVIGLQLIIDFNFTTLFSWVGSRHMVHIKTFTENWNSKHHLLELPWPI